MRKLLFIVFWVLPFLCNAQISTNDKKEKKTPKRIWNIEVRGSYDIPMASMAERFGNSFRIGGGIKLKTKRNWIFGSELAFIVGGKIKEEGLLQNVRTERGDIINQFGELLNIGEFQRGYAIGLKAGKTLPILNPNENSGLTLETSIGFVQHKINLFDIDNNMPQIRGEYRKGYDRLTNGLYLKQFLGYTYYSPKRLINFNAGLDFMYGFTQGRREYWYDVQKVGTDRRNDLLLGASFSWLIPLYKKITEETYY